MKEELWLVLKPSPIEGVGVFTERSIKVGEYLRIWATNDWRTIRNYYSRRLLKMCTRFGVSPSRGCYYYPRSFVRMSLAWYLNHSVTPNVRITESGRSYASRAIKKGEELTINYMLARATTYKRCPTHFR